MGENEGVAEVKIDLSFWKKNWVNIVLILILILGFYLRVYHLDSPVIGYHNWKETHYLAEARNFAESGDWLTPRGDFYDLGTNPEGAHGDSLPLTSWFSAIGFLLFGIHVWVARFISVIFVMFSVLLLYLIVKKLFKRNDLALVTALVAATNPLLVFFGRQVQLINPALFFGLLSIYLYLIWLDNDQRKFLVFAVFSFVICFLTKYSFAIFALPMLAIFPLKKLKDKTYLKTHWKTFLYAILPVFLIPLWFLNNARIVSEYPTSLDIQKGLFGAISYDFSVIFTSSFWQILKSYAADNYTLIGVFFAFIGLILFLIFSKRRGRAYKFLLAYVLSVIPWFFIMGQKLSGHSYHQYPIAPLVIILISLCFVLLSLMVSKFMKNKKIKWAVIFVLFLLLIYPPFFSQGGGIFVAKDRQFDVLFPGIDVAGQYIKENSNPDERIFFSGHQSYGIVWESDRKGIGAHYDANITKIAEETENFRWVFVYQWGLEIINDPEKWDYIKDTYSLKQVGYLQTSSGPQLVYLLFEKGGSFDLEELPNLLNEKQAAGEYYTKDYELTSGTQRLIYFNL